MRRIASEWHGGQASPLYAFASTGATVPRPLDQYTEDDEPLQAIRNEIAECRSIAMQATQIAMRAMQQARQTMQAMQEEVSDLDRLLDYVERVGARGPQGGLE